MRVRPAGSDSGTTHWFRACQFCWNDRQLSRWSNLRPPASPSHSTSRRWWPRTRVWFLIGSDCLLGAHSLFPRDSCPSYLLFEWGQKRQIQEFRQLFPTFGQCCANIWSSHSRTCKRGGLLFSSELRQTLQSTEKHAVGGLGCWFGCWAHLDLW